VRNRPPPIGRAYLRLADFLPLVFLPWCFLLDPLWLLAGVAGKSPSGPQVVEVKGLSGVPAAAATGSGATSTTPASSSTSSTSSTKEEAEESKEAAKETKAEKAPPPTPVKVSPSKINKLSHSTGRQHQEEVNALGAQPIETG
jgi:hypothetical protein